MRLLFKGGTVVTGKGPRRADILVEGEKIDPEEDAGEAPL